MLLLLLFLIYFFFLIFLPMETLSPLKLRVRKAFGLKTINVIYFLENIYYVTETESECKAHINCCFIISLVS